MTGASLALPPGAQLAGGGPGFSLVIVEGSPKTLRRCVARVGQGWAGWGQEEEGWGAPGWEVEGRAGGRQLSGQVQAGGTQFLVAG